jgi:hypothetical protein
MGLVNRKKHKKSKEVKKKANKGGKKITSHNENLKDYC